MESNKQRLWAPWKMEYVENKNSSQKIFTDLPNANNDEENLILFRGEYSFIIMNRYPYNNGHLMIVPFREVNSIDLLEDKELHEIISLSKESVKILKEILNCDGFNLGANTGYGSGASIDQHLHFHVVPRWKSDTSFMPVVGNTRVIHQSLSDTYSILKPLFNKLR
jgi:ATP adenylyltransferase